MSKPRILFSMPTRHHVEIALDEVEGLQALGYECAHFPYAAKEGVGSTLGRLWVLLKNARELIIAARNFKPDVIYLNSRLEALAGIRDYITIALCKTFYGNKVKYMIKSHGSDLHVFNENSYLISKVVLPYLKKNISGWLFLSTEERKKLQETGYFDNNKLFVTKNIVRTRQFKADRRFKSRLNIPSDHTVLLFVGRIIKEKGVYEVINAFAQLKDNEKITLIIVGSGPEYEPLKKAVKTLGISAKVIFTGFIPEKEVTAFYANCDILVFPTFFPEGFPMALFNSVAAGMAIITTPTRAAIDYLAEPENCLWVKPQDSNSVSAAIQKSLQPGSLIQKMRDNNLIKGNEFCREQVAIELAEIISQITNR